MSIQDKNSIKQIEVITNELEKFSQDREWQQFHNPKDLAIALSIEVSELLEQFLWKTPDQADRSKIKEELADVLSYAFLLAKKLEIDVEQAIMEKIQVNQCKYPIELAKGNSKKYLEF